LIGEELVATEPVPPGTRMPGLQSQENERSVNSELVPCTALKCINFANFVHKLYFKIKPLFCV